MISTWFNFFKTDGNPAPENLFAQWNPTYYFHPEWKVDSINNTWTDLIQGFVVTGSITSYSTSDPNLANSASVQFSGSAAGVSGFTDNVWDDEAGWTIVATFYKPTSGNNSSFFAVHSDDGTNSSTLVRATSAFNVRNTDDDGNLTLTAGSNSVEGQYLFVIYRYIFTPEDPNIRSPVDSFDAFTSGSIDNANRISIGSVFTNPSDLKVGHVLFFDYRLSDTQENEIYNFINQTFLGAAP